MKKFIAVLSVLVIVIAGWLFNDWSKILSGEDTQDNLYKSPVYKYVKKYGAKKEKKGIKPYIEHMKLVRGHQNTGTVDMQDVYNARQKMRELRKTHSNRRSATIGLQWEELGPDNVGGRTRGMLIDKDNQQRLYAGGVSGGLFVSNNGGLSWTQHPSSFDMDHMGISTIAQASNGDIYVGTGESFATATSGIPVTFGAPSFIGEGIYKSTDGGITFFQLQSTIPNPNTHQHAWSYVNEIAINPTNPLHIYAATNGGVMISEDGGNSWTSAKGLPAQDQGVPAVDVAMGSNGIVHACIGNKYYRSQDGENFVNRVGEGGFPATALGRMEFVVSPEDPNYVYAVIAISGSGALRGILRSTDGGINWSTLIDAGTETMNVLGEQGFWNIALGVDPRDKDKIFVGGQLELWSWTLAGGWNLVAYWQPDSPTNPYYVHADMHNITFDPVNSDVMYVVTDGGVFKTLNSTHQFPTFTARNKGYNVTQFYGMQPSIIGELIGGTQDNGTQMIDFTGNTNLSSAEVSGGDGGDAAFSRINTQALFSSTYGGTVRRSSNKGESFGCFYDNHIDANNDCSADQQAFFLAPNFLWEDTYYDTIIDFGDTTIITSEKSIFFLGVSGRLWFTPDALNFSSQPAWYYVAVSGVVSEIEISSDGVVFAGTGSFTGGGGNVYRIEGITDKFKPDTTINGGVTFINYVPDFIVPSKDWTWAGNNYQGVRLIQIGSNSDWTGSARYVTGIAVDPNDNNHVVVTLGNYGNTNYVYRSTNATANSPTFTSRQSNLPAMPVYDAIIDYHNANNIILGTELGIWASADAGLSWNEENQGMATVPTFQVVQQMLYNQECQVIYIGTHGRGLFRTTTLTPFDCKLAAGQPEVKTQLLNRLSIYPNPIADKAFVELDMKTNDQATLQIIDVVGRVYRNINLPDLQFGVNRIEIDFSDLPGGVYIVAVRINNEFDTKRVFVTK